MKVSTYLVFFLTISIGFITSCRTEEVIIIDPPATTTIKENSKVAVLMSRTALKDGSIDNIIDKANCITVKLPVTVTANGKKIVVKDENGYNLIEEIFDEFKDDQNSIAITFPVKVTFSDYTVKTINSTKELNEVTKNCTGENEQDDDLECADFNYPIKISYFNENNELADIIEIKNDEQLYNFIKEIKNYTAVTLNFPVKILEANGSFTEVATIKGLEEVLENNDNLCDEDDDNDYNDDDCNTCTIGKLKEAFETQNKFKVDDFEQNGQNIETQYEGYLFSFEVNGTINVVKAGTTFTGTWEASGSGNEISFVINISELQDFNKVWKLQEIKMKSGKVFVEFIKETDTLVFERAQ